MKIKYEGITFGRPTIPRLRSTHPTGPASTSRPVTTLALAKIHAPRRRKAPQPDPSAPNGG
jgi:hypothetical protein